MIKIRNSAPIQRRGFQLCGNDDFQMVKCVLCGCQYLEEEEIGLIFFDPTDLSRTVFDFVGEERPPCRGCGAQDWLTEWMSAGEELAVRNGDWAWLYEDETA